MVTFTDLAGPETGYNDVVTLPYQLRQKSRLSTKTDQGVEIGVILPRGQSMRAGCILIGTDDFKVLIKAASEPVSVLRCEDMLAFAKACYHLGNRHVALQIEQGPFGGGEFRYLQDHVLDHLVEGLGMMVTHEQLSFEPENGAYHSHHAHE